MNELFDQITAIAKAQNKSIMAGIELGRDESAKRIKVLETANANLLEALSEIRDIAALYPHTHEDAEYMRGIAVEAIK